MASAFRVCRLQHHWGGKGERWRRKTCGSWLPWTGNGSPLHSEKKTSDSLIISAYAGVDSEMTPNILTILPPSFFPCRTEPQSSLLVPAQDGPSEKLGQRLATETFGANSWERDKTCRELGPARAHRWDTVPPLEPSASASWVCENPGGFSDPFLFSSSSLRACHVPSNAFCSGPVF